ncbi:DUF7513 family protein [Halorientalis sp.]|uniref:DUF7513 family protein n=1 Tax=Halorientalis sp. TaxID=1931229 RepID=UPI003BB886FA
MTPWHQPGGELVACVTGSDGDASVRRIGDARLERNKIEVMPADITVRVRVTAFDDDTHRGEAELLDALGTATFCGASLGSASSVRAGRRRSRALFDQQDSRDGAAAEVTYRDHRQRHHGWPGPPQEPTCLSAVP